MNGDHKPMNATSTPPSSMAGWRLGALSDVVDRWWTTVAPTVSTDSWTEDSLAKVPDGLANERMRQVWLHRHATTRLPPSEWLDRQVEWIGVWVEDSERQSWNRIQYDDDALDWPTEVMWRQWEQGDIWSSIEHWKKTFLPAASRSFRAVMARANVPTGVRQRVIDDLRDGFQFVLHGAHAPAGFRELAARVLETAGPIDALALTLDDRGKRTVAECIVHRRGHRRDAVRALWPATSDTSRVNRLVELLNTTPEAWCDAELLHRLGVHWSAGRHATPMAMAHLIIQVRGRMRSRLRSVAIRECPARVMRGLTGLDSLTARTRGAVSRLAERWAYRELSQHFAMDINRPLHRSCEMNHAHYAPITSSDHDVVRTWVLLTLLKGRAATLESWVDGQPTPPDSTWDRLLHAALPNHVTDGGTGRVRGYHRIRDWLTDHLDEVLLETLPTLRALSQLPEGRKLKHSSMIHLAEGWNPSVPIPSSGFPRIRKHAIETLRWIDERSLS